MNATQYALLHRNNVFGLTKKGVSTRWPANVPIAFVISDEHKKYHYRKYTLSFTAFKQNFVSLVLFSAKIENKNLERFLKKSEQFLKYQITIYNFF